MNLAALFSASLLVAATTVQDQRYECAVHKLKSRGSGSRWTLEVTLRHNFPARSVFSLHAKRYRHVYNWTSKEFDFGVDELNPGTSPVRVEAKTRTAHEKGMPMEGVGLYELSLWFDPSVQSHGAQIRRAIGDRHYYRHDFPAVELTVGGIGDLMDALESDTNDCEKKIARGLKLMERIERESERPDWKEKIAPAIFKEINKMRTAVEERRRRSLHHAAYQILGQVLQELTYIGQQIKLMKEMDAKAGSGGGGDGQDVDTSHPKEGGDQPIVGDATGKKITLKRTKEHLRLANTARLREYLSWIVLLHEKASTDLWRAYRAAKKEAGKKEDFQGFAETARKFDKALEEAYKRLAGSSKWGKEFETWAAYKIKDKEYRYADDFEKARVFTVELRRDVEKGGAISADLQEGWKELRSRFKAVGKRVRGK